MKICRHLEGRVGCVNITKKCINLDGNSKEVCAVSAV